MKKLFTYAVLFHEHETNDKNEVKYKDTVIVIEPKTVVAKDEKELVFKITREIPEKYATDPNNVQILVKAF